jgi:hypothetical protein
MPKVHHVRSARKDYPDRGIAKGQEYWWWKFFGESTVYSLIQPKRYQLTRSQYLINIYKWIDELPRFKDTESFLEVHDTMIAELISYSQELTQRLESMKPQLRNTAPSGKRLQIRIKLIESVVDTLVMMAQCEYEDYNGLYLAYRNVLKRLENDDITKS